MRIFYDTEFIEDGQTIDLISIGMVREDGSAFYAINQECDTDRASQWVQANVLDKLTPADWKQYGNSREEIAEQVRIFVQATADPIELWGYYSAYDHVAFCQLFGPMIDLPKGFPMYTRDLKQWCDELGNPPLPKHGKGEHNALLDAQWNLSTWQFLDRVAGNRKTHA